jgi:hypothetical protein
VHVWSAAAGLPAAHPYRFFVAADGLMSYGMDYADVFLRAASYVDRTLKGEKPADLPVQTPTEFELVKFQDGQCPWPRHTGDVAYPRRRGDSMRPTRFRLWPIAPDVARRRTSALRGRPDISKDDLPDASDPSRPFAQYGGTSEVGKDRTVANRRPKRRC